MRAGSLAGNGPENELVSREAGAADRSDTDTAGRARLFSASAGVRTESQDIAQERRLSAKTVTTEPPDRGRKRVDKK